ncbi:MAG: tetratricopeptide repeat protein [Candidatus Omnitrophota bacterium]
MKKNIFLLLLLFFNNVYGQVSDPIQYNEIGNIYFSKGKYEEAIINYTHSLELNPKYTASLCNRGSAYYNLRQFNEAINDFNKVIELEPGFHSGIAYIFRASSYLNLGKFDRAIEDYSKAIEINPLDARFYADRANAYYFNGQYDFAKMDYEKAIELDKNGKTAKSARQKLNTMVKQGVSKNLLNRIDFLKRSWANELDMAGYRIAEKNYNGARINIQNSINLAGCLKQELLTNNLSIDKASAMEKLSLTYQNLNTLFEKLEGSSDVVDLIEVRQLVSESYEYLDDAQPKFQDAPLLKKVCQEIRKGLDGISLQLRQLK